MTVIERATHLRAGTGRRAFAVFLALHGIAHLVGTSDSFERAADGKTADYLGGLWKVSNPTTLRVLGVAWAIGAIGFLATVWASWMRASWRLPAFSAATRNSVVLCVAGLWALQAIGPRDHRLFQGVLDPSKLGFLERKMAKAVKAPMGDFRDWSVIDDYADEIAAALN